MPDVARLWGRTVATLGLAPLPPGTRPRPGAAMQRMMFAFVWLILGVIMASVFVSKDGAWWVLAMSGAWFALGALDVGRARRLFEAEHRTDRERGP